MRSFIAEKDYPAALRAEILPYLSRRREEGSFKGYDGKSLYAAHYRADAPRGTVVLLHGFSQNAEKYRELIYYFLRDGLSVLIYDQRGHGRSPRTAPPEVTHIDRFDEYVEDLEALLSAYFDTMAPPFYLYGHSMGGAVAALYLEKHPDFFSKASLSAPMIEPKHGALPMLLARGICQFCMKTGRAKKRIFISLGDGPNERFEEACTVSPARFEAYRELRKNDPLFRSSPPTYTWTYAALGVKKQILAKGAPERIGIPVRIYAADRDYLVRRGPQEQFISRLQNGELIVVEKSKHEFYAACDEVLHPYVEAVLNFFS